MPRTVTLEDSGLFISACATLGIAHPPGYPTYTMLGHLFTQLPFGSPAANVHLFSALCGAGACSLLWLLTLQLFGQRGAAWLSALALAFSDLFWSQAIIAEVYALNALLFVGVLWLAFRYMDTGGTRRLLLLGFAWGFSLSNHHPLMLLATPGLLVLVLPRWRHWLPRLPLAFGMAAIGLLPYLYLWIRSRQSPVINFLGPLHTFGDLWSFVSRRYFLPYENSASASRADQMNFAYMLLRDAAAQLTPAGALLAVAGCAAMALRDRIRALALGLSFLGGTLLVLVLVRYEFDPLWQSVFRVYPQLSWVLLALWAGGGFALLARRLPPRAATAMALLLGAALCARHWPAHDRHDDTWAEDYGRFVLDSLEPDAAYFTGGDLDAGPLAYLNLVLAHRPDVTLYNEQGLMFETRLFDPRETTDPEKRRDALIDFALDHDGPVYATERYPGPFGESDYCLYHRARTELGPGLVERVMTPETLAWFRRLLDEPPARDAWEGIHRRLLIGKFGDAVARRLHRGGDAGSAADWRALAKQLEATAYGNLGMATAWTDLRQWDEAQTCVDRALREDNRKDLLRPDEAHLWRLSAHIAQGQGKPDDALARWRRAVDIRPNGDNPAVAELMTEYVDRGDRDAYAALRERFGRHPRLTAVVHALDRRLREGR